MFQHQMELVDALALQLTSGDYRLLIVDSVISLFRVDYHGRGELNERQFALGQFLQRLTQLSEQYNIAVLMVRDSRLLSCSS
jgi:meiotic recombination protein DMC1